MWLGFTLAVTKAARLMSRVTGRGGGEALPGLVAERLDPHLAGRLAEQLRHGVILVTGTNGKTTTTKLIAAMLEAAGERVVTNSTGSNLKRGVTSALISAASLGGVIDATIGLFEVDEASLRQVSPELKPRHIVVLNLFRDQLDRYGELDVTAALIGEGIAATTARLYLNADDPLVASLGRYAPTPELVHYFGIEELPTDAAKVPSDKTATDSDRCPLCRDRLVFDTVFYGHLGHYRCPQGHFGRPRPDVALGHVVSRDLLGSCFRVAADGRQADVEYPLPGTYNLYNALAATSVATGVGIDLGRAASTLAAAEAAFGRVERVQLRGRTLCLLLVKNPAGFAQVLDTFLTSRADLHVMFVINDLDADGRDVSWLWDVPLEALAPARPAVVIVAGIRAADMAVRLHYAGVACTLNPKLGAGINDLLRATPEGGTAYVLPTYTAMLAVRKALSKRTQLRKAGT